MRVKMDLTGMDSDIMNPTIPTPILDPLCRIDISGTCLAGGQGADYPQPGKPVNLGLRLQMRSVTEQSDEEVFAGQLQVR